MDSIQIPYHVPSEELPSELPTKDAIEGSKEVLCEQSARKVVGVGSHFVVKYGLQVDLGEGQNMIFIKNTTSVSVPKVYALFKDVESNKNYVIMERISGDRLDSIWTSLDHMQKLAIALQVRASFIELRKLHSPDGYCSLDCKPLRDHLFYTGNSEESLELEGPFKTEMEFNDALIKKYLSSGYLPVGKADYYRRAFPSVLNGHPPTFTHGDLQRKNIIVGTEDGSITIIDWEFAGWYPSYWEYARAIFACGRFDDDWSEWIDFGLDVYRNEWAWMQMLIVELWS
jgi:aminoglycoside phosphotransferase (APT) family kinase protein